MSRRGRRRPGEAIERVESRRFVTLRESWVVKHRVDKVVQSAIQTHHGLPYMNEFGGILPNYVDMHLGGANFAPSFFPDDRRIVFSSNHHDPAARGRPNFDLFAVDLDGGNLERITFNASFDSFPQFSPDGRYLVFSSNRGGSVLGETNVFIAEWR